MRRFKVSKTISVLTVASALALSAGGCGDSDSDESSQGTSAANPSPSDNPAPTIAQAGVLKLNLTAGGFESSASKASLTGRLPDGLPLATPAPSQYPGIGVNFGDTIVEGLKIRLTGVSIGTAPPGSVGTQTTLVDWSTSPRELQIASGFTGSVGDSLELALPEGTYNHVAISYRDNFDLKAYAYLDRNNDGQADATVYTTKADVVLDATRVIAASDLAALGYDYYHYSFTNLNSRSIERGPTAVDNTDTTGTHTFFDNPLQVTSATTQIDLNLLVAVDRIAKVWDGRYGDTGSYVIGDGKVPAPGMPFPKSDNDSRTGNVNARFPVGQPEFALDYVPVFGFINTKTIKSQAYLVSLDTTFTGFNSQTLIVVVDSDNTPLVGRILINDNTVSPHLGQCAKKFTKESDGSYTFYSEYGVKNASGVDDGGFFYSDDVSKAGFILQGFKLLAAIGDEASITVTDGPRCKEQYDYCVASASNNLGVAASSDGKRQLKIKRIR